MHIMRECFIPFVIGFAFQKDSIYTQPFSKKIQQLVEGGFINKWMNDEMEKVGNKASNVGKSKEATPLTVQNLQVNGTEV